MGSLLVDNCTDVENNGFCFSESDGTIMERTLDVGNTKMTFGGLRTHQFLLQHPNQIKSHDFVGCIRNIYINGKLLRPTMGLAVHNVVDRCPRATVPGCDGAPCKNGGVCHDLWSDYVCECKSPFMGRNCATEMSEDLVLRFNKSDYIEYVIKERFKRDYLLKLPEDKTTNQTVFNIKFRTRDGGVLLSIHGQTGSVILMIRDRKLVYLSKEAGHLSEFIVEFPVADGLWHILSLFNNGHNTFLSVDDKIVVNSTNQSMALTPVSVQRFILGAPIREAKLQQSGFSGCVQYFSMNSYTLPISGHSEKVAVRPSSALVQSSCSSPDVCHSSPCSKESFIGKMCSPADQNMSCICLQNVSGHICDICIYATLDCYEVRDSKPLWLIAVVLPLISTLAIVGMCVLFRLRLRDGRIKNENFPPETGRGTENMTFCFDDVLTDTALTRKQKPRFPVGADQQRTSDALNCDASRSGEEEENIISIGVQPMLPSELEYYEIGSICSAFHSGDSVELGWREHFYTNSIKDDSKQWGTLRTLLSKFGKESSGEDKSPSKSPKSAVPQKQLFRTHTEQPQPTPPCPFKRFPQPELLEPTRCLTFEEIRKLNSPTFSQQASLKSAPAKSNLITETSSECDTNSTFTCSDSDYGQFPEKCLHDRSSLSEFSTAFKRPSSSAAGQIHTASLSVFEHFEDILNMQLPFSSYAPVFEDIAHLPTESSDNYDLHSDLEEII